MLACDAARAKVGLDGGDTQSVAELVGGGDEEKSDVLAGTRNVPDIAETHEGTRRVEIQGGPNYSTCPCESPSISCSSRGVIEPNTTNERQRVVR